jgi:protoporphyrinogen oxidase
MKRRIGVLIAGCGPCGLGAALELEENLGSGGPRDDVDYLVVDPSRVAGGWASSRRTAEGYTFDFGGHVLFPHKYYSRFAELLGSLPMEWVASVPKRGVSVGGRFLPYPAQRNLRRLGPGKLLRVLASLAVRKVRRSGLWGADSGADSGADLGSYLSTQFGEYLTRVLMGPLNSKMWGHATSKLSNGWVTLRSGSAQRNVPDVSLRQTMGNVLRRRDSLGWTSDTLVTYPAKGGSGRIWQEIAAKLPADKLLLGVGLKSLSLERKTAVLDNGDEVEYGALISSVPIDVLLRLVEGRPELEAQAARFVCARSRLFGFGVRGVLPAKFEGLHSFHVPDADVPFWRVTFPSNISVGNVPAGVCFSVLCEVSEPRDLQPLEKGLLEDRVEAGLRRLGVLGEGRQLVSRFYQTIEHGYPVPFLGRDALLNEVQTVLQASDVYSRGRFGAWKYEISNQDHAFMQGVEAVRRVLFGIPEQTYADPCGVNEVALGEERYEAPGQLLQPSQTWCVARWDRMDSLQSCWLRCRRSRLF